MISDVVVRDAGAKGQGVFALRAFRKGEFIFRRRHGRIVPNLEVARLSAQDRQHLTELDFDWSAVLLPPGCYLNHSHRQLLRTGAGAAATLLEERSIRGAT